MKRLLQPLAIALFAMAAGYFGSAIYNAQMFESAHQEALSEFAQRVDLALADNMGGSGSYNQVDGTYTALNGSNQFTIANPVTGQLNIQGVSGTTGVVMTFPESNPANGSAVLTQNGTPTLGTTAELAWTSTDPTNCLGTGKMYMSWVSPLTGFVVLCNGKANALGGLIAGPNGELNVAVGGNTVVYKQHFIGGGACGTRSAPLANSGTCPGDSGFITGGASTATLNFTTAWGSTADMLCEVWADSTPSTKLIITYVSTSQITWPSTAVTYDFNCKGVSGG